MITKKQIEEYREANRLSNAELTKEFGKDAGFDKELTDEEIIKELTDWEKEVKENSIKHKELIMPFTVILDELKKYSHDIIKNTLDFSKNDKTDELFEDKLRFMKRYIKTNNRDRIIALQEKLNLIKKNKEFITYINKYDLEVAQALIFYFQDNLSKAKIHFVRVGKSAAETGSPWIIDTILYYLIFVDLGILEEMKKYEKKANKQIISTLN
jgi:hypothetical protein